MNSVTPSSEGALTSRPPLLITESATEFASLCAGLARDIKPQGEIERRFVDHIAAIIWEIKRLQRCKTGIINTAFLAALRSLLEQLTRSPGLVTDDPFSIQTHHLAKAWFFDPESRNDVLKKLNEFGLDEVAIEAEAIRLSSSDLELLDRMLASLESRYNKALRCIADYQCNFSNQVRQSSDRIRREEDVHCIEHDAGERLA